MLRRIVSGIMFMMLFIGMLTLAFNIQSVKTGPRIWTVDDDSPAGFSEIRDAITVADSADASRASIKHWSIPTIRSFFENGLDTRLMDVSQFPFEVSGKLDFGNEAKWGDFAYVDDDSAELVIGLDGMRPNSHSELVDLIMSNGGELVNTVSSDGEIKAVVADIPHGVMSTFVSEVEIAKLSRYIEPNMRFEIDFVPNDPDWLKQWGPHIIEADCAWNTTTGDPSVLTAVIDTGIDWDHPDLTANYVALGYDWVNNDPDPMDDHGHGTHCGGVIAAVTNNNIGIAGLAQVRIMAEKGIDELGYGRSDELANAIIHAVDQGADILSCSWGSDVKFKCTVMHEALKYAYDHGVLVIGAAGNDATNVKHYPAAYDEVMAVTATDESDNPAGFTNFGDWVEVAAPGVHVYSTIWDDSYAYMSGTSMSAPHVSGVAALIWSQFPSMTPDQVRAQLRYTSDDLGDHGFDVYHGYGRVNARRAVEQAPFDHDVLVLSWLKPRYVNLGTQVTINSTILNMGTSDESSIAVQLLVNDSVVDSETISSLVSGESALVSCLWVPAVEGVYNVTSYVVPVLGETATKNNALSAYIPVRIPKVLRVPDDYDTIQGAIDAAIDGDTVFVASGTYVENVWIDKESLKLVGEDVGSTIIEGAEVVVAADNVNVNGFTIQNGDIGIVTYYSKGSLINNTRTLNNEIGIYLLYSANIALVNNNMTGNRNNLDVDGYSLSDFIHKVDTSNLVNGRPVYYWIDEHDKQVPSDAGYVAAVNSTKIVINDLNLTDNGEGVLLVCTTDSVIENVNASNNYDGIYLAHSSANAVGDCFVTNNYNGICFYESRDNNVSRNIVIDNYNGIYSYYSNDNEINFNKLPNKYRGLFLEKSDNNTINNNRMSNNTYGIYLRKSSCNVLKNNNMTNNEYNFGVTGTHSSHFVQDIDTSNTVNGKPVYYWVNQKDKEIPAEAGYVAVVNSTNIAVRGLNLTKNAHGVLFAYTSESLIEDVNTSNNMYGIYLYSSSNNTIVGNTVTSKSKRGIQLISSSNNTISNNVITNNYIGVGLWLSAENNAISSNAIFNGTAGGVGLYLDRSGSNTVGNNTVTNNDYGIELYWSDSNTLRNNNMTSNSYNFGVYGGPLSNFIQDIDTSNTMDGKPMYYLVNQHSQTIPAEAGYVAVINSTNITVKNLNLVGNLRGVLLVYTTNSTITNVTASANYIGVYLWASDSNTIIGNKVTDNEWDGIGLYYSDDNTIAGNTVTNNAIGIDIYTASHKNVIDNNTLLENIGGIMLHHSDNNVLSGNKATGGTEAPNGLVGISLTESKGNVLSGNAVSDNQFALGVGIVLDMSSTNNTIVQNMLSENIVGILTLYSNDNTMYHNNFIDNTEQVRNLNSINTWDNGCEGNYWSNYNGTDSNGDGIGDTYLPWEEVDYYPLMNVYWNPGDVDHDLDVDLYDAVRLLEAYGSELGDEEYNCHCDINEPYGVINLYDAVLLLVNYGEKYP